MGQPQHPLKTLSSPKTTAQVPLYPSAAGSASSSKAKTLPAQRFLTGGRQWQLPSLQQGRGYGDTPRAALLWGERRSGPVGQQPGTGGTGTTGPGTHLQQCPAGLQLSSCLSIGTVQAQQLLESAGGLGVALGPSGEGLSSCSPCCPPTRPASALSPLLHPIQGSAQPHWHPAAPPAHPQHHAAPAQPQHLAAPHPALVPPAPAVPCPCGRSLWATRAGAAATPAHP